MNHGTSCIADGTLTKFEGMPASKGGVALLSVQTLQRQQKCREPRFEGWGGVCLFYLRGRQRAGQVLLVGQDEQRRAGQLLLLQQAMQLRAAILPAAVQQPRASARGRIK